MKSAVVCVLAVSALGILVFIGLLRPIPDDAMPRTVLAPIQPSVAPLQPIVSRDEQVFRVWAREARNYVACSYGTAGHNNRISHFMACVCVALVTNRIVLDSPGDYMSRYYDFPPDLMPFARANATLRSTYTLGDPVLYATRNLTALFEGHTVVTVATGLPFTHGQLLYLNPLYGPWLRATFGIQLYGWVQTLLFRPHPPLQARIEAFYTRDMAPYFTVGIHIRYGRGRDDGYFRNSDAIEVGYASLACALRALVEQPRATTDVRPIRIFLACDNAHIRRIYNDALPASVLVHQDTQATPDNANVEGVIFDTMVAATADVFIGTYYSTVSNVMAWRHMRPYYAFSMGMRCQRTTGSEVAWPAPGMPKVPGWLWIDEIMRHVALHPGEYDNITRDFYVDIQPHKVA